MDSRQVIFLRVEAVNLAHFIFDNQDLSTTRGGGLLLLHSVRGLPELLAGKFALVPISTGASVGLFSVQLAEGQTPEGARKAVQNVLAEHGQFGHATFVVDIAQSPFTKAREELIARNRWQQMRSLSLSSRGLFQQQATKACEIDLVRPASCQDQKAPAGKRSQSESVHVRRDHGRTKKQDLYEQETGIRGLNYSQEFEELSSLPRKTAVPSVLYRKMAVLYFDGNHFGKMQSDLCNDDKKISIWDRHLLTCRRSLLAKLVEKASNPEDLTWRAGELKDGPLRLETLLWGGDELIWVVPAWKGWEVAQLFFDESAHWQIPAELAPRAEEQITHAGGLVFCGHNAPIHRVTRLAKSLAELAKDVSRDRSLIAFEVLESFDHIGDNLVDHLARRSPESPDDKQLEESERSKRRARRLVIDGNALGDIIAAVARLKSPALDFRRKKHHEIVHGFLDHSPQWQERQEHAARLSRGLIDSLERQVPGLWSRLRDLLGGDRTAWAQLWHLWDYVTPVRGEVAR